MYEYNGALKRIVVQCNFFIRDMICWCFVDVCFFIMLRNTNVQDDMIL